jgi:hypothetical protein
MFRAVAVHPLGLFLLALLCTIASPGSVPARAQQSVAVSITVSLTSGARVPGAGQVVSSSPRVNCLSSCQVSVAAGTALRLQAVPADGYAFDHWDAPCRGGNRAAKTCTIEASPDGVSVAAVFTAESHTLVVIPGGSGTVSSGGNGIECSSAAAAGSVCAATFFTGARVTLTATPGPATRFLGWSVWECPGRVRTCTIRMTRDRTVEAAFDRVTVTVHRSGTGGTVVSEPAGISCADGCSSAVATYPRGTVLSLTAVGDATVPFRRWGEPCGGPLPLCRLTLVRNETVDAAFGFIAPEPAPASALAAAPRLRGSPSTPQGSGEEIFVQLLGRGGGSVTVSGPALGVPGIRCERRCLVAGYQYRRTIRIRASRGRSSRFVGWRNGCHPRTKVACTVHVEGHNTIGAEFARRRNA